MKKLIFDLDGTLLNTLGDIGGACNVILKKYGFPVHEIQAYKKMVGNGFDKLVERALPTEALSLMGRSSFGNLVDEAKKQYAEHMMDATLPYQDMPQILAELKSMGKSLAVLSNKPDNLSNTLVKFFFPEITFTFIRGALPNIPLKPDPEALYCLVVSDNLDLSETIYIGDSDVDMQFAHNTKVIAGGACWGFRGKKELEKSGANVLLDKPEDLLKL